MIKVMLLLVLVGLLPGSVPVSSQQTLTAPRDSLSHQLALTEELIAEREVLLDSLQLYKERLKFQYELKKGKPYEVVHPVGKRFRIFHYRIADVDPYRRGKDTIFVGATTEKK